MPTCPRRSRLGMCCMVDDAPGYTSTVTDAGERLLLAIDVGNTNVKLGTFKGDELTAHWRLQTDPQRMPDEYAALLDWVLARRGLPFQDILGVSLSSTVPAMVTIISEVVGPYLKQDCPM